MPNITIMLKPASSLCNMQCEYCFYSSLALSRDLPSRGMMNNNTVLAIINKALDYSRDGIVNFIFQGGEPLLIGKEFYRSFFRSVEIAAAGKQIRVNYSLQTNGVLIDKEWCELFRMHDVLIGLSLDGIRETNAHRIKASGDNSYDDIMRAGALLTAETVEFNILTVLTKSIANHAHEVYRFYKSNGYNYIQFINCLMPLSGEFPIGILMSDSEYLDFLKTTFILYYEDYKRGDFTSIRYFDNLVLLVNNRPAEQCGMNGFCPRQIVIESDGTIYPCDFYCVDEWELGNINSTDFYALSRNSRAIQFIQDSLITRDECKQCNTYKLCNGGCRRYEFNTSGCNVLKEFLAFALPILKNIIIN